MQTLDERIASALNTSADFLEAFNSRLNAPPREQPITNERDRSARLSTLSLAPTSCVIDVQPEEVSPVIPTAETLVLTTKDREDIKASLQSDVNFHALLKDPTRASDLIVRILTDRSAMKAVTDALTAIPRPNVHHISDLDLQRCLLDPGSGETLSVAAAHFFNVESRIFVSIICLISGLTQRYLSVILHRTSTVSGRCWVNDLPDTHHLLSTPDLKLVAIHPLLSLPTAFGAYDDLVLYGFSTGEVTIFSLRSTSDAWTLPCRSLSKAVLPFVKGKLASSHTPLLELPTEASYNTPVQLITGLGFVDSESDGTRTALKAMVLFGSGCLLMMTISLGARVVNGRLVPAHASVTPASAEEYSRQLKLPYDKLAIFMTDVTVAHRCVTSRAQDLDPTLGTSPFILSGHVVGTVLIQSSADLIPGYRAERAASYLQSVLFTNCAPFSGPVVAIRSAWSSQCCTDAEILVVAGDITGGLSAWLVRQLNCPAGLPLLAVSTTGTDLEEFYSWCGKIQCSEALCDLLLIGNQVMCLTTSGQVLSFRVTSRGFVEASTSSPQTNLGALTTLASASWAVTNGDPQPILTARGSVIRIDQL
ncbi:hypothetical protein GMRT_10590 [Giardia muris]|uniref:Uncharacterized protein n=1 Tax=Giardia muris TaxID=5742 RepID=A0A4Z1T345_GIAMU|nr:hypothetical protein GMRT_10590 [Giardia muris]|eukprot:TNJ26831.1 hypothetical protein GMRT_10590 [Giardia muris]